MRSDRDNRANLDLDQASSQVPVRDGGGGGTASATEKEKLIKLLRWKLVPSEYDGNRFEYFGHEVAVNQIGIRTKIPTGFDSDGAFLSQPFVIDPNSGVITDPVPGSILNIDDQGVIVFNWSSAVEDELGDENGYRLFVGRSSLEGTVQPHHADIFDSGDLSDSELTYDVDTILPSEAADLFVTLDTIYDTETVRNQWVFGGPAGYKHRIINVIDLSTKVAGFWTQPNAIDEISIPANLFLQPLGGGYPHPVPVGAPWDGFGICENEVSVFAKKRPGIGGVDRYSTQLLPSHGGECVPGGPLRPPNPNYATLVSHANGATLFSDSVTLQIAPIASAIAYRLDLGTQSNETQFNGTDGGVETLDEVFDFDNLPDGGELLELRVWTKVPRPPEWRLNRYRLTAYTE